MKVIIAGSRSIDSIGYIGEAVIASKFTINQVVSGTANGADLYGEKWAEFNDVPVMRFPAKWKDVKVPGAVVKHNAYGAYNAVAGHQRNAQMGDYADALIAVWDGKSRGTLNMVNYMKKLDKPVFVYDISIEG